MPAQLKHIREVSARPNVTLQLLPFSSGTHTAMGTAFTLLDFAYLYAPAVYLDNLTSAIYLEEVAEVDRYRQAFEHLRATALELRQSQHRLDGLRREQESDS